MVKITDFPDEFTKSYFLCFSLMQKNDFNFFDNHVPFLQKYWRFFIRNFCLFIQFISMSIYIVQIFSCQVKISDLAFMVSVYLFTFEGFLKIAIIIYHKESIEHLIIGLGKMWRTSNLTDVQNEKKRRFLKTLHIGQIVFYWCCSMGICQIMMTPLFMVLVKKFILHQNEELLLPLGSTYFFDYKENWLLYIIAYVFQTYSIIGTAFMYCGIEFLIVTICAHLSIEFSILQEDFKHIVPKRNNINLAQNIAHGPIITIENLIDNHQKLTGLTKLTNDIFNKLFFINLLFATIINGLFAFVITIADDAVELANNIVSVLVLVTLIYILCHYSQLLIEESGGITESAYENLWYQGDINFQKSIGFVMARSQKPCCLLSLNHTPITLNTFTKVVSTTWSYLSLARTMYTKN